ncbi:MAG: hypothetical protein DRJ35_03220 [Thermoprotei archaeon]|nr:MAG: hypothetical protein DRJ35_03220 [Thermoprotei archaeon]
MSRVVGAILCGGEGRRLRPLTYYFQKSMIPVGSKQKPLLEYIVRLMNYHGVKDIVMLVGYKGQQVVNYFNDGERFGVRIKYVWDNPSYEGNGGSLYNAYNQGFFDTADNILVYYGDILSNVNLTELIEYHRKLNASSTLALSKEYRVAVGVVELNNGNVVKIEEKPPLGKPVTIGILVVKKSALQYLGEIVESKGGADIMGDFLPYLLKKNFKVGGYITDAFWYDVGSTEKYEKLDPEEVDKIFSFLI